MGSLFFFFFGYGGISPSIVCCVKLSSSVEVPVNKVETISFSPFSALVSPVAESISVWPLLVTADGFRVRDDLSPVIVFCLGMIDWFETLIWY